MIKMSTFNTTLIAVLAILGLTACGGGGSGNGQVATSSGSTVVGTIGGFGSVILNDGVEYNTDNVTSCEVDDENVSGKCDDSMAVGMIISMQIDTNGAATSIKYDNELEGPAANIIATGTAGEFSFEVFGVSIATSNPGTQWRNFTTNPPLMAELNGANVEVSGEWQGTMLNAQYIEKQNDSTFQVKGTVGVVTGSTFSLTLRDGTVIDVDATGANLIPQEGDYVEAKGTFDGVTFTATDFDLEDEDDFDSDGEVKITGTLTENAESSTGFSINSTNVDISNAPSCDGLVGTMVDAEGAYDQSTGVLIVDDCEDEEDQLEMKCLAGPVTVDTVAPKVGSVECTFPGITDVLSIEFRDTPELAIFSNDDSLDHFDLTNINTGDCVEIEASTDISVDPAIHVAGLIELDGVASACSSYKLKGPVDAFTVNVSITVLGVTFIVDGTTDYPNGMPVAGDNVKIIDAGDGVADSVKID